jgi:hypothetical protein
MFAVKSIYKAVRYVALFYIARLISLLLMLLLLLPPLLVFLASHTIDGERGGLQLVLGDRP